MSYVNVDKGPTPIYPFGIDEDYDYREIDLESNRRAFGSPNNSPIWAIDSYALNNVVGLKVISAQIPFSYYVIWNNGVQGNNSFTLTDNAGTNTVVLPIGNYTSTTILPVLGLALTTASGVNTYTVTYSSSTGRLTITSSNTTNPYFVTFGADNSLHAGPWLGFSSNQSANSISGILSGDKLLDITGPSTLRLNSNLGGSLAYKIIQPGSATGQANQGTVSGNILASIPVTANPFGFMNYEDPADTFWFDTGDQCLNTINLYFTWGAMENPSVVDFNGVHWQVKLCVLTPKRNNIYQAGKRRQIASGAPF